MSEYADKHSNPHRKERVEHILRVDPKAKIDASGYTPPDALDADVKTGPCKPKPRAFAKGGKVEGEKARSHAGRKARGDGGPTAVEQLRPQVPISGLYGSGFQPTHAGMLSNAGGLKDGGEAKRHKDKGGGVESVRGGVKAGGRKARADGGPTEVEKAKENYYMPDGKYAEHTPEMVEQKYRYKSGGRAARAEGGRAEDKFKRGDKVTDVYGNKTAVTGVKHPMVYTEKNPESSPAGGVHHTKVFPRAARAEGGRAKSKGKTNINIIIGSPKPDQSPMVPPPPSAMPPAPPMARPNLPPAALGAMAGPMGAGGPGAGPAMPPQMPPGVGPR